MRRSLRGAMSMAMATTLIVSTSLPPLTWPPRVAPFLTKFWMAAYARTRRPSPEASPCPAVPTGLPEPEHRRRELVHGPSYGWIHHDNGITQVELSLYRITTGRPCLGRQPEVTWVVDWRANLTDEAFAPITGDGRPVTEDAVRSGTWDVLACTLLRNEFAFHAQRYGRTGAA
ncbi:hypothetical protein [Nonomuraea jiangxiensis]|uniref:Secreted protein n=1 Tax=Nonomuraea jiangxiensis TaxID=633440 RepID=A0A1G8KJV2_9ACTN|nr:hypothetical protein [Nonomuraea jiangxiensis]SDI43733.1 hypothetical protein SAMN05421869_105428 [Nonomuraea jiangxiensis]